MKSTYRLTELIISHTGARKAEIVQVWTPRKKTERNRISFNTDIK
jgi:hypothetical protein